MITYILNGPFPKCCKCGDQLDWWDLRQDQSSYVCDPCTADQISDRLIACVQKQLDAHCQSAPVTVVSINGKPE